MTTSTVSSTSSLTKEQKRDAKRASIDEQFKIAVQKTEKGLNLLVTPGLPLAMQRWFSCLATVDSPEIAIGLEEFKDRISEEGQCYHTSQLFSTSDLCRQ
jgi:hypothetical protein